VSFSGGTTDTGDLLLRCDGFHSSVRKLYVHPQIQPEYSGTSTIYSFLQVSERPFPRPSLETMAGTLTLHGASGITPSSTSNNELFWLLSYEVPKPDSGNTHHGWGVMRVVPAPNPPSLP